jgi:hypothetical protein
MENNKESGSYFVKKRTLLQTQTDEIELAIAAYKNNLRYC